MGALVVFRLGSSALPPTELYEDAKAEPGLTLLSPITA